MGKNSDQLTIIIKKAGNRIVTKAPLSGIDRLVFVINRQFTNAPNTTQITSGAGRSSAAGNDAAINSPNTNQQQSVGTAGTAKNKSIRDRRNPVYYPTHMTRNGKEVVVVINEQIVKLSKRLSNASATQVASGAGTYSTGGTNSAIESPNTKQQFALGAGGGFAINQGSRRPVKRKLGRL